MMAITKVPAPGTTPATFWPETIDYLNKISMQREVKSRMITGYILQGSLFSIGGALFIADSNTEITGYDTGIIKLTVSGNTATASYVSTFTGVAWNYAYNGYYDADENIYLVDETREIKIRKTGTDRTAIYNKTVHHFTPQGLYGNSGYIKVAGLLFTFSGYGRIPAVIKEINLTVLNASPYSGSVVQVRVGSTIVSSWNDESSHTVILNPEYIVDSGSVEFIIEYLEYGAADLRGAFTIDAGVRIIPDCPFGDSDYQLTMLAINGMTFTITPGFYG